MGRGRGEKGVYIEKFGHKNSIKHKKWGPSSRFSGNPKYPP